jgi:hypothetical protein
MLLGAHEGVVNEGVKDGGCPAAARKFAIRDCFGISEGPG